MLRAFQIIFLSCLCFYFLGCKGPEKEPPKEQIKIGDLAPANSSGQSADATLKTINFYVHVFEAPYDNISRLDRIWSRLNTMPFQFNSYEAFRDNLFSAGLGSIQLWNQTQQLLRQAGAQRMASISLLLSDNQPNDIIVTGLDSMRTVSFVAADRSRHKTNIGPGAMVLRIKAAKVPTVKNTCTVVVQPVFTLPATNPIPELSVREKAFEFPFTSAAFGLRMTPGDFVILGPRKFVNDLTTLPGIVFFNPLGSLFFSPTAYEPPARKSSFRIFLLVLDSINE